MVKDIINKKTDAVKNNRYIREYALIVAGVLLASFGLDGFLIPNKIAAGGVSGIATILYYLFGFPVGVTMLVINIPLFIAGGKVAGRAFFFRTLMATILMSLYIDLVPTPVMTTDMILATVYGGTLVGIGLGLTIYAGATTGGSDMAAKILHARVPKISVATFLFVIDVAVVLAAALVMGAAVALYAIASLYISSKLIDVVVAGFKTGKAYFIITTKPDEIKKGIIEELDRGVTIISATGGYSGEEKAVLLCAIRRNAEVVALKRLVARVDEKAFMIATNVTEVLGEGFND